MDRPIQPSARAFASPAQRGAPVERTRPAGLVKPPAAWATRALRRRPRCGPLACKWCGRFCWPARSQSASAACARAKWPVTTRPARSCHAGLPDDGGGTDTSRLRGVSSLARLICPSRVSPAVERSSGVSPSQAAKSRPDGRAFGSGVFSASIETITGPIPGIWLSRWAVALGLCRARNWASTSASRASTWARPSANPAIIACAIAGIVVSCCTIASSSARWDAPLAATNPNSAAWPWIALASCGGARTKLLARGGQRHGGLLIPRLGRHEAHRRTPGGLTQRLGISRFIGCPNAVSTGPVMRRSARLKPPPRSGRASDSAIMRSRGSSFATPTARRHPRHATGKCAGRVHANPANRLHERPPMLNFDHPTLARLMAFGDRQPQQARAQNAACGPAFPVFARDDRGASMPVVLYHALGCAPLETSSFTSSTASTKR